MYENLQIFIELNIYKFEDLSYSGLIRKNYINLLFLIMKLASLIFIYLLLQCITSRTIDPVQEVLAKNDNPNCVGDCLLLKKVKAIFPLKGAERHLPSILNQFNWKFVAVYSDHMTVYDAPQTEPMV